MKTLEEVFDLAYFESLFSHIVEHGSGDKLGVFALIFWSLWIARNKTVFNSSNEKIDDIYPS